MRYPFTDAHSKATEAATRSQGQQFLKSCSWGPLQLEHPPLCLRTGSEAAPHLLVLFLSSFFDAATSQRTQAAPEVASFSSPCPAQVESQRKKVGWGGSVSEPPTSCSSPVLTPPRGCFRPEQSPPLTFIKGSMTLSDGIWTEKTLPATGFYPRWADAFLTFPCRDNT